MASGVVAGEPIRAKAGLPFTAGICCIVIFLRKVLEEGCQLPRAGDDLRGVAWSSRSCPRTVAELEIRGFTLESTNGGIF